MATLVAFHAHPDDEVILTGGTLAGAVAAGHRVVLVTATDEQVYNWLLFRKTQLPVFGTWVRYVRQARLFHV